MVAAPPPATSGASPAARLLLALFLASLFLLAQRIILPGVDVAAWRQLLRAAAGGGAALGHGEQVSIVALGLVPLWTGFVFVELLALAAPALRPLRETEQGRRRLTRGALTLALLLALAQGYFLTQWLRASSRQLSMGPSLLTDDGLGFVLIGTLTLAAGTMGLVALAWLISRVALGNGFSLLLAAPVAARIWDPLMVALQGDDPPAKVLSLGLMFLGTCGATVWVLQRPRRPGAPPLPTSGVVPLVLGTSLLGLALTQPLIAPLFADGRMAMPVELLSLTVGCIVLSWLFHGGGADGSPRYSRGALAAATLQSLAFLYVLFALSRYAPRSGTPSWRAAPLDVLGLVTLTAVVLDLLAERRMLREHGPLAPAWRCHRVADADDALAKLDRAGIAAHPRALYHRSLWHFFAPLLPIDLLVPRAQLTAARLALGQGPDLAAAEAGQPEVVPPGA